MKLKKLLKEITGYEVKGSKEILITGISANSKMIAPGNLFIAKKGKTFDGSQYIPEAIRGGASAVLTDLFNPALKQIVQIIHADVSAIEGNLAASFYHNPSEEMLMVGITGTNGKTTTSFIVRNLLEAFSWAVRIDRHHRVYCRRSAVSGHPHDSRCNHEPQNAEGNGRARVPLSCHGSDFSCIGSGTGRLH